jgi:hypothetical protein
MRLNQGNRGSWGYQVSVSCAQSNIAKPVYTGRQSQALKNVFIQNGQEGTGVYGGDGIMDSIRGIISSGVEKGKSLKKLGEKASDIYTGEIGTALRNLVPSSDENARSGFAGEKHAILKLPNGKFGVANYMGPGTHLEARLRRGDPPRTMSDKVAQAHDSRYALARSQSDVAAADRAMIKKLKEMQRKRQGNAMNIQMGLRPIQAKLRAEQLGLVKSGSIASFGDSLGTSGQSLVEGKLSQLEQEGFGLPGDVLKMKLLHQMHARKRRAARVSGGKKIAKRGGSLKLAGQGLGVAGGGLGLPGGAMDMKQLAKALAGCVSKQMLPMLLKKLGLPQMGNGKLNTLMHMRMLRALNDGASRKTTMSSKNAVVGRGKPPSKIQQLKSMAGSVSKALLPILINMAMKKMKGGRMETVSMQELNNPTLMQRLSKSLATGAFNLFKKFISSGASKGSGGMCGSGFFSDFARGFKKGFMGVMTPALKIAPLLL